MTGSVFSHTPPPLPVPRPPGTVFRHSPPTLEGALGRGIHGAPTIPASVPFHVTSWLLYLPRHVPAAPWYYLSAARMRVPGLEHVNHWAAEPLPGATHEIALYMVDPNRWAADWQEGTNPIPWMESAVLPAMAGHQVICTGDDEAEALTTRVAMGILSGVLSLAGRIDYSEWLERTLSQMRGAR